MPARKTPRTHAQGDASRRTILDATLRIAAGRGYVGTTVALVKKETGLPASSLYWHFKDKDELLAEALEHGFARWHEVSPRWEDGMGDESLPASLARHFQQSTAGLDEEPGFWRMGLMLALETGPAVGSQARERFLRVRAGAVDVLQDWWAVAAPTRDVPLLARLTMASLDGLFVAHQADGPERVRAVVPLVADGLAGLAEALASRSSRPEATSERASPEPRMVAGDPSSGRTRLLAAAAEVAAESGYEGATISRICARAGLPASSLYWHFKDKDDLLAAVVQHSWQDWTVNQPAWLPPEPGRSWQEELRSHLALTLRSLHDDPAFLRIGHLLLLLHRSEPPAGRARFLAVRRRQQMIIADWFRVTLDADSRLADDLGALVMVLFDGLFFSGQLDAAVWNPAQLADALVGVVAGALETVSA